MDLISPIFEDYQLTGGFTGDTEVYLTSRGKTTLKELADNPNTVHRGYAIGRTVTPTILGLARKLGSTSIIELEISNQFKLRVGRKQGFYSPDGNIMMADQLQKGDQLMGMTPDMFQHADAGSEMVYAYLSSAYFRVTGVDETTAVESVYSLTSPKHNRFILANGLMVQAVARPKID